MRRIIPAQFFITKFSNDSLLQYVCSMGVFICCTSTPQTWKIKKVVNNCITSFAVQYGYLPTPGKALTGRVLDRINPSHSQPSRVLIVPKNHNPGIFFWLPDIEKPNKFPWADQKALIIPIIMLHMFNNNINFYMDFRTANKQTIYIDLGIIDWQITFVTLTYHMVQVSLFFQESPELSTVLPISWIKRISPKFLIF